LSGHIAIFGEDDINVAPLLHWGLYALQHRGEVGSGLVALDENGKFSKLRGNGLVSEVYDEERINSIPGNKGAAHCKYAFASESKEKALLPEVFKYEGKETALSIDGNFLEKSINREDFIPWFNDLESLPERINNLHGAYSIIYIDQDKMVVVRDPWGIKSFFIGKYNNSYVVASETCAIDAVGGEYLRDLAPGEIVIIDKNGMQSKFVERRDEKTCIFEFVYLSRQDSNINGKSVYEARYNMGRRLADESPVNADVVIDAPDSGTIAALGFSHESGIQYREGILKNRYVGRTFILPDERMREKSVQIKHNPLKKNLKGKRVILVDDSIVRGTTIKNTVKMLKDAGAIEVHVRIACPPVTTSCDLCVDTPSKDKLIGANYTVEETRDIIGADSLAYLSLEGLTYICGGDIFCKNCFDGKYPIEVENGDNV
jgi:amidophosphoribosyltransferase